MLKVASIEGRNKWTGGIDAGLQMEELIDPGMAHYRPPSRDLADRGNAPGPGTQGSMIIERWFEMGRKWTFQMPKLRKWVEDHCEGNVLNLFGGVVRLPGAVHNDLNADLLTEGDLNRDAFDLALWREDQGRFNTVVFDPPYSAHQAVVSYGTKRAQRVTHARDVAEYVLAPHGRVISLGFNSTGMSESRGFRREAMALVNLGASHNDFIITVERKTN